MRSIKMPKIFERSTFWVPIGGLIILIIAIYVVHNLMKKHENFDNYALASGKEGDDDLRDIGLSSDGVANLNSLPIKPKEDNPLTTLVNKCQAVKGYSCEAIDDPNFSSNCGICASNGVDSMGKKHVGGMYIDPDILGDALKKFRDTGLVPKLKPTVGVCNGDFLVVRPDCDTQRDRAFCSQNTKPSAEVFKRCGMCANADTPTFINMSQRGPKSSNYAIIKDSDTQTVRMRVITNGANECTMYVRDPVIPSDIDPETNAPREKIYKHRKGTFFDFELKDVRENQPFELVVKWPEYYDYAYSGEEKKLLNSLVNPRRAPIKHAYYGTVANKDQNGDEFIDVVQNIKGNNRDCGNTSVKVCSDVLGNMIDPAPKENKQLRLIYGDNDDDTITAYGLSGSNTLVSNSDNDKYKRLCPEKLTQDAGEEQVCTKDLKGVNVANRKYIGDTKKKSWRVAKFWGAKGETPCIINAPRPARGITGIIESVGNAPRQVALEKAISNTGEFLGTMLKNSLGMDHVITERYNIQNNQHWFWPASNPDSGGVPQISIFKFNIPATLKDTPTVADTSKCSSGPIIRTMKNVVDKCSIKVDGMAQKPGTYTSECMRSLIMENGCTNRGRAYPSNQAKIDKITGNGSFTKETIARNAAELYSVAKTGKSLDGKVVSRSERMKATIDCFGKTEGDICNPFNEEVPPMPLSPECLDYLWLNKGKKTNPTYGIDTRGTPTNSGTFAPFSTACPATFAAGLSIGASEISPKNSAEIAFIGQKAAEIHAVRSVEYSKANQLQKAAKESKQSSAAWNTAKLASKVALRN